MEGDSNVEPNVEDIDDSVPFEESEDESENADEPDLSDREVNEEDMKCKGMDSDCDELSELGESNEE